MKQSYALLLFALLALLHTTARAQPLEKFLSDPAFIPASVGICITDVATGETLVAHNERQAIIPASTVKVITTATALRLLGSTYRTSTFVGYTGYIDSSGTLHGNLVIRGGGDPSLGSAFGSRSANDFIDQTVSTLQAYPIRAIEGGIIVDDSRFDGPAVSNKWMLEDIAWGYATGCHAFSYRDNRIQIDLRYNGHHYEVTGVNPTGLFLIDTRLVPGEKEDISVIHTNSHYTITGTIPRNRSRYRLNLAIDHPDSLFRQELCNRLQQAGIPVGEIRPTGAQESETRLLDYPSDPLACLVRSLNVRSDNLYAESLLRLIALSPSSPGSVSKGIETIRRHWQPFGADSLELFLYDGSGLARSNKVSARYLARVLEVTARDSLTGETFVQSLPRVGREGSVATFMRNNTLPGELRLKSGSMSDVHAYAGYYTTPNRKRYAIVLLFNNYTCSRSQLKQKIAAWLTATLSKKR